MDIKPPIHFNKNDVANWTKHYRVARTKFGGKLRGFKGSPFQRGDGKVFDFFKSVFGYPVVSYLGRKGATAAIDVGSDILSGENVKEAFKKRGKSLAKDIASDVAD